MKVLKKLFKIFERMKKGMPRKNLLSSKNNYTLKTHVRKKNIK